jgi:hypothetical protein
MELVQGRHFEDLTVDLDGKHLIDCTFYRCTIQYAGGALKLERTQFRACRHAFSGPARLTVDYLRALGIDPMYGQWTEPAGAVQ